MTPSSLEVGIAAILAFGLGFVWYGPLFGKRWCKAAGKKEKDCKMEPMPIVLSFFGWLAAAAVFGWLLANISHTSSYFPFGLATILWLAFMLPGTICDVLWGKRDKNLIWIDGFYSWAAMGLIAATYHAL